MATTINAEYVLPPTSATNTATSSTSTAAIAIGSQGAFRFVAQTVDCWILFGDSTVAAATTANALVIPAGTWMDFMCGYPNNTHFRVITAASAGNLSWARTGA